MVLTLDNGQTITIYEQQNIFPQIKEYIDKEIFELLEDKFGFIHTTSKEINIVKCGSELIGQTVKYCEIANGCDIDHNVIATEEGNILMFDVNNYGDEDSCTNLKCFNRDEFERVLTSYKYIRDTLLENEIISKNYVNELLDKQKDRENDKQAKLKEQKYQEYLKLKKEFEINE